MIKNSEKLHIEKSELIQIRNQNIVDYYTFDHNEIGKGAYGVVYRAKQKQENGQWRAVKKIAKKMIKDLSGLHTEMKILQTLDHPGIVKLYEIFEDQRNLYLVIDLCEGGQLFDRLIEEGNFSEHDARHIFLEIIEAIHYCHKNNICHRDLKPENFLFLSKESYEMNLIDFGLSFIWQNSMKEELIEKGQTKLIGTSYYLAPQIIHGKYDERCDIWSAGVILYILVTSIPPFDGDQDADIIAEVKKGKYRMDIPEIQILSPQIKDLISRMLKPEEERITLEEIFNHPWLKNQVPKSSLKLNFKKMQNYAQYSKIKKIVANFIAVQLSERDVEELGILFKSIDTNHDGYISLQELKCALDQQKQVKEYSELNKLMAQIDANGKINYTQFLAFSVDQGKIFRRQNISKVFNMIDQDHNGKVDKEQLEKMLKNHHWTCFNGKEIDEIMLACDKNHDGTIDLDQFISILEA